jgi:hypothetical protein
LLAALPSAQFWEGRGWNKTALPGIIFIKQHTPVRACGVACSSRVTELDSRQEVRAMKGEKNSRSRPYWIRYIVAFWAGEKLEWARDNVVVAFLCSIAPGVIAAGISAALNDDKWRAAAYATLLTYGGLFALFLMWRLVATPWELDRERQRFIDGLNRKLGYTRLELVELQASPPAIDVEALEIHVQLADTALSTHTPDSIACDIFLRVKLTLRQIQPIRAVVYELSSVLHGTSIRADLVDDIEEWGLVTQKKPVGVGKTFHYTVTRLMPLARKLEQPGVPVEGWLHFCANRVHEKDMAATVYRLTVLTPKGAISRDIAGANNFAGQESRKFQNIPSCAVHH